MNKVLCTIAVLIWSMAACQTAVEQPTLSHEKTARIMADLYVAETATWGYSGYAKDSLTMAYYKQVFELHGVTKEEYEQNLHLMAADTVQFEKLVRDVRALLAPDTTKRK